MALGLAEERQARERQLRRRRGAGQERGIVLEKARRGRGFEEVDGVVERDEELRLAFPTLDRAGGEGEVHRELPLAGGEALRALGRRHRCQPGTRPGEEHLKRGLERQIGIRERRTQGAVRRRHQPLERRIAGPLDA